MIEKLSGVRRLSILKRHHQVSLKTPGDGFEPPLKEPESFVLPLDDPGLLCNLHRYFSI